MPNWLYPIVGIAVVALIGFGIVSQRPTETPAISLSPSTSHAEVVIDPEDQPTSTCSGQLTPALTEGPYYKASSPQKMSLREAGVTGTPVNITGRVLDASCQPVAGAWLDFWQADAQGAYDNAGYTLRGHQFTDDTGHYRLETIVPAQYGGRTPHIHVKVRAPEGPAVTTQLFFPGETRNQADSIFNQALIVNRENTEDSQSATFDFVIQR